MAVEHARGGPVHLTSSPVDWYAARAGGIVAYVLLSANVAIGLLMTGKKTMKHWPRFALEDVHRFGGILVGTFLVVHITAVAIDAYLPFSLTSLVVPLVASYRPIWTALGIVAAELLLALAFTNHYRNVQISYRFWRRAHFVNFVVWGSATLHGLGSGTDRSAAWFVSIYAVAVGTVCALTTWRLLRRWHPSPEWVLRLAPVTAALIAVVTIGGLARGPLRFQPKEWNAASFSDTLDGQILVNNGVTRGMVSMAGNGSGPQRVLVRADLLVAPQRLVSTEFQMEYLPSGALCTGTVTQVHGSSFQATCHLPDGSARFVDAHWPQSVDGNVTGGVLTAHG
jgi:methionine sulfoxide reductase heme-binding subunit